MFIAILCCIWSTSVKLNTAYPLAHDFSLNSLRPWTTLTCVVECGQTIGGKEKTTIINERAKGLMWLVFENENPCNRWIGMALRNEIKCISIRLIAHYQVIPLCASMHKRTSARVSSLINILFRPSMNCSKYISHRVVINSFCLFTSSSTQQWYGFFSVVLCQNGFTSRFNFQFPKRNKTYSSTSDNLKRLIFDAAA